MPHRFFCPLLDESGRAILTDSESHHMVHVLRSQPNDIVELFNGQGDAATCRIAVVRKREVELEVLSFHRDPPPEKCLTLATAAPKGDRFDWLIEKTTEIGVTRLSPLVTTRSVVDPRTSKLDKLRQTVVAACKQSGRNRLMEISPVISWADFIAQRISGYQLLIAHPEGIPLSSDGWRSPVDSSEPMVAIGPEGGFTDDEITLGLGAGAQTIGLGAHILRIETAAIAIAAKFLL